MPLFVIGYSLFERKIQKTVNSEHYVVGRKVMKTKKIMIIPGPDPWPRPGMSRCGDGK
jgi:hypothetical protein